MMGLSAVAREDETEADVTWEDQQKICTFGRLNQRFLEIGAEIKDKKEDIEKMNDAANEIFIADDIKYVVGEAFVSMEKDAVEAALDARKEEVGEEIAALERESARISDQMKELKAQLYAKFGKSIYLENE
eukprot:RCo019787